MAAQSLSPQDSQKRRNRRLLGITLLLATAGFAALGYWWFYGRFWVSTDDAYVTGNLVLLKAQTRGTVVDIRADNTQYVHQGALLVRLNGAQADLALERAEANLAETVRHVETLFSQVDALRGSIAAQEADLTRVQHDLARYRQVVAQGAVSNQQVQDSEDQAHAIAAKLRASQAQLRAAEALVGGVAPAQNPLVLQAANALKEAYLDYGRRALRAPVSGFVAKRSVNPGDQVQPGTPLLAIVPLNYLWVEANVKETDMRRIRPGQPALLQVDFYGTRVTYHGRVLGLGAGTGSVFGLLPPENATGNYIHIVERVPVRIGLSPQELAAHPLRPGLSVLARIDVSQPGNSILQPLTEIPGHAYETDIYKGELQGARILIDRIIRANEAFGHRGRQHDSA